jgi:hypothetical protein
MELFAELLEPYAEPVRVLDVGGCASFWVATRPELPKRLDLTLLNLDRGDDDADAGPDVRRLVGDARRMTALEDGAFDVCFSNSVIEHVGSFDDQRAMAAEVRRIARSYFIQTPYRYFPIEAHYHVPGWQFLPLGMRARLHQRFDLGWMNRQPDFAAAYAEVSSVRLLDMSDYRRLFPDARIRCERLGPLVKSLMAVRSHRASSRLARMQP